MSEQNDTTAPKLAELLALNHIYLSVGHQLYQSACRSLLRAPGDRPLPPRIVVVVGAGATNAACGLPTGAAAATRLRDLFRNVDRGLIDDEIHRISVEYRLESHDFETVLLALSKFDQISVLRELGLIYNRRHYPWLGYELLAHWLKHRYIDAIINFNFDEILDQAVDDELGGSGYYRAVSDGDCPNSLNDWIDPDEKRFRFPLYLKPHGTASHKSSMRFTRSSYTLLPRDLHDLLSKLFDHESLYVIVIGHAMQSVEFNDILFRERRAGLRFVFIDWRKPQIRRLASATSGTAAASARDGFLSARPPHSLASRLREVAELVTAQFRDDAMLRGIDRHVLISDLFAAEADLNLRREEEEKRVEMYLKDRVYVELALAVAKARGFLSTEHIAGGRVGRYYRLYRRASRSQQSILSFCEELGLKQFGYARDTVYLPTPGTADEAGRLRRPTLERRDFDVAVNDLAANTRKHLSIARKAKVSPDGQELIGPFTEMYRGDEVEVSLDLDAFSTEVFASPKLLHTLTSLHVETHRIFDECEWDALVCTAESGLWLVNDARARARIVERGARLAVIVADQVNTSKLKAAYGELIGDRVLWLPWWLHNRHVTVFLQNRTPVDAIYFERRLRTSQIVPLRLADQDATLAMDAFVAYWTKASQADRDAEIDKPRLEMERRRLLDQLYAEKVTDSVAHDGKKPPADAKAGGDPPPVLDAQPTPDGASHDGEQPSAQAESGRDAPRVPDAQPALAGAAHDGEKPTAEAESGGDAPQVFDAQPAADGAAHDGEKPTAEAQPAPAGVS